MTRSPKASLVDVPPLGGNHANTLEFACKLFNTVNGAQRDVERLTERPSFVVVPSLLNALSTEKPPQARPSDMKAAYRTKRANWVEKVSLESMCCLRDLKGASPPRG